jgi:type VI secretion system protein ImpL
VSSKEGVPSMLDAYHDQLRTVVAALEAFGESRDAGPLRQAVSRARRDIEDLVLRSRAPAWEPALRKLLLAPLGGLEGAAVVAGAEAANRRWCEGVVAEFDRSLGGRYPFFAGGADAPLSQVEKFLHPQTGALWQYVREALTDFDPQTMRPRAGTSVSYRAELAAYLRRAQVASELLFPRGAQQITVPIEARIWPGGSQVTQTALRIGSERIVHRNDAERFQSLSWPAKDAVLSLKGPPDQDVVGLGDWGLFRLLDRAQTRTFRSREEFLRATFFEVMPGVSVSVDFKPYNLLSALRGLHPPRAIAVGRSPCAGQPTNRAGRDAGEGSLAERGPT